MRDDLYYEHNGRPAKLSAKERGVRLRSDDQRGFFFCPTDHAEQIGAAIRRIEQAEINRSVQLQLPIPVGAPIPVLYVEIDGTGIRVVKKELQGPSGIK